MTTGPSSARRGDAATRDSRCVQPDEAFRLAAYCRLLRDDLQSYSQVARRNGWPEIAELLRDAGDKAGRAATLATAPDAA